jgi:hypothetical protein
VFALLDYSLLFPALEELPLSSPVFLHSFSNPDFRSILEIARIRRSF